MEASKTINDFQNPGHDLLGNDIGYFNILPLQNDKDEKAETIRHGMKKYFKITLHFGESKTVKAKKKNQALIFASQKSSNAMEDRDVIKSGFYCIFNQAFFRPFGNPNDYTVFQINENTIFELTDNQLHILKEVFERMIDEFNSDYIHKYDMIRTIISELIHFAIKMPIAPIKLKNV